MNQPTQNASGGSAIPRFGRPRTTGIPSPAAGAGPQMRSIKPSSMFLRKPASNSNNNVAIANNNNNSNSNSNSNNANHNNHHSLCFKSGVFHARSTSNVRRAAERSVIRPTKATITTAPSKVEPKSLGALKTYSTSKSSTNISSSTSNSNKGAVTTASKATTTSSNVPTKAAISNGLLDGIFIDSNTYESMTSDIEDIKKLTELLVGAIAKKESSHLGLNITNRNIAVHDGTETAHDDNSEQTISQLRLENESLRKRLADLELQLDNNKNKADVILKQSLID